jgi:aspartyl-tRNA(Asn)/glutamyl-tRNA(Gln) amidotransferase subunit A
MPTASSRDRLEQSLSRIADPKGEGARCCLTLYEAPARAAADAADARQKAGISLGPLDGAILTIKDLFDVKGEVTRAGSKVVADEGKPAAADAPIVQRLRAAGAVIVAKTNMTEFAFSALGLNPHFGTPGNPFDRTRVPGGSSSGAAVGIADGMCEIGIGSDTGGSTRIPAVLCGITGWKPSKQRVPTEGAFPLSFTLDSVGPMAKSVDDCALADAIMAGDEPRLLEPFAMRGLRLGIASGFAVEKLDDTVSAAWKSALSALEKAGAQVSEEKIGLLDEMVQIIGRLWLPQPEALSIHRDRIARRGADLDQMVKTRIERAATMTAAEYVTVIQDRARLVRAMHERLEGLDGLVMPTVPIVPPRVADCQTPEGYAANNLALLRNTAIANFFDLCAISLPLPLTAGMPAGLMILARNGDDNRLFRVAAAVEKMLRG